jgi:hypothetical protein
MLARLALVLPLLVAATAHGAPCDTAAHDASAAPVIEEVEQSGVHGLKTCAFIAAPPDAVWATLTDYPAMARWMNKVKGIEVNWVDARTALVNYKIDTSMGDYHYLLRRVHTKPTHIEWTRESGDFKVIDGSYTFSPATDAAGHPGTLLEYVTFLDTGMPVPYFLVRSATRDAVPRLFKDLREEVARRQTK